jgi:hypothetical protein
VKRAHCRQRCLVSLRLIAACLQLPVLGIPLAAGRLRSLGEAGVQGTRGNDLACRVPALAA